MELENKIGIVTGGAQGIGKAIVKALAAEGANVAIFDVNEQLSSATAAEVGNETKRTIIHFLVDVSDYNSVERAVNEVAKRFSRIDILVNNAGITRDNLILRMAEEDWDRVIAINLKGVFNCTKACSKIMLKQHYGRIINISSVVGLMGNIGQVNYAASKGGVIAFTKSCARELASRNILVNAIAPGYIETAMTEKLPEDVKENLKRMIPLGRLGRPEDVASAVVFLCSDKSSYITGQVISDNGGMYM